VAEVDCVTRIRELRQRIPAMTFDVVRPGLFVIIVPGHDEPFQSESLCDLVTKVETWLTTEIMARLLFGVE
jgi:hypothetical protein